MLGLLIIIVISWLLLYFVEKKNIDVLGIVPNANRIRQFLIGCFIIAVIVLINIYIETIIQKVEWENKTINYNTVFDAFIYHLKSALTEDLVFRGAILYILIRKIGSKKAILISAIFFGVYHVFSYGMIGARLILIVYVVLITGFTGYVWAYSFYKTKSIMLGLGFHLGYNMVMAFFFQSQPYGELLFTELSRVEFSSDWHALSFLLFKGLFPSLATLVFLKLLLRPNSKIKFISF